MNDLDIKQSVAAIYSEIVDLRVETQTILQLMVAKNIVTADEVSLMRDVVKKNSKPIKQLLEMVDHMENSVSEQEKDVALYNKSIVNREALTEAERIELNKILDDKARAGRMFANVGLLKNRPF